MAEGQPWGKPETEPAGSTYKDREPLVTVTYARRVRPQANFRIPPEHRAYQDRGQAADTDCLINSGGGADDGHRF